MKHGMILFALLNFSFAEVGINNITLEGFNKKNEAFLKKEFGKFIDAVETHEVGRYEEENGKYRLANAPYLPKQKFPIKTEEHERTYSYSAVADHKDNKTSNTSRSLRWKTNEEIKSRYKKDPNIKNIYGKEKIQSQYGEEIDPKEDSTKELIKLLNQEGYISKIVITKNDSQTSPHYKVDLLHNHKI